MVTELEIGIVTDDLEGLTAFYVDGLGFSERSVVEFPEGVVRRLRRDRAYIKLYLPTDGALAPPLPEPWHRDRGSTPLWSTRSATAPPRCSSRSCVRPGSRPTARTVAAP